MKAKLAALLVTLVLLAGCEGSERIVDQPVTFDIPAWLEARIEKWEAGPRDRSPGQVSLHRFGFKNVIYIPPWCSDCFGDLRDVNDGAVVCHPDGGILGEGDGRCPGFDKNATLLQVVWVDPRGAP